MINRPQRIATVPPAHDEFGQGYSAVCNFVSKSSASDFKRTNALVPALLVTFLAALCGCSSSSSPKTQVISIAVTDANGNVQSTPLTSLTANTGVYLDVALLNDSSGLGADWTVACGSATAPGTPLPPGQTISTVCGTFTPVHTLSAPVPNFVSGGAGYVTLYTAPAVPPQGGLVTLFAAATSDPSRYASLAFPIAGLPISIGFAPQPPATLPVSGTIALKAVVSNDYTPKGVTWSVICGSGACGTFSPVQTASGVATTYTAPSTVPAGGKVTVTATSVTDPTKSISSVISIAPIAVSVLPTTLSVAVSGTGLLNATVTNDLSNAGVDWSLSCSTQDACGSITSHTSSGAPATYTAPSDVPPDNAVTATATSTADKASAGTAAITITATATPTVSGIVRSGHAPVAGSSISLYAAGETGYGSAAKLLDAAHGSTTAADGSFTVSSDVPCPSAESLLYVVARGGEGEADPALTFITPLSFCNSVAAKNRIVLDEATTVVAAYALSGFTRDAAHIGAPQSSHAGISKAFATANEIADAATGEVRSTIPHSEATIPQAEINTLANAVHGWLARSLALSHEDAATADRSAATGLPPSTNTLHVALSMARDRDTTKTESSVARLFELAKDQEPFVPSLNSTPDDWLLLISYPAGSASSLEVLARQPDTTTIDSAGNAWVTNRDGSITETIGAAPPRCIECERSF